MRSFREVGLRALVSNLFLVTVSRVLDGAVRFLTVPLVLHHFGNLDFGLIALAFSFQAFLALADFGLSVNAVRRFSDHFAKSRFNEIVQLAGTASFYYALIGAFNFAVMLAIGVFGQNWFNLRDEQAQQFFWMMAALGLSSAVTWAFVAYRQIIQSALLVGWDELVNLTSSVLTVAMVAATLYWNLSPALYFALVLIPPLVPLWLRLRRAKLIVPGLRVRFRPDWRLFRPLVGTSIWVFVLMLAELAANNYRPIILSQQAGLESMAEFRIVQQIAGFALLVLSGCMSVIYPTVARMDAAGEHSRISLVLSTGSRLLLWAHLGMLITLAFLGPFLLRAYVGEAYVHLAGALTVWLITLVAYHNAVVTSVILSRGKVAPLAVSAVINTALSLMLAYTFAPRFGIMATVWSYAAYVGAQLLFMYLISAPGVGVPSGFKLVVGVFAKPMLFALGSAGAALLAVHWMGSDYWAGAIIFALTFAMCAVTAGGVPRDWAALRRPVL